MIPHSPPAPPACMIRLRRDGLRPLCFSGTVLAQISGRAPGAMLWHDLALYRTAANGYVTAIVAQLADTADSAKTTPVRSHAMTCSALDEAISIFERHDARDDLCPGISAPALAWAEPGVSPAMLMLQAAMLQSCCDDTVCRYRIQVGRFLTQLYQPG